MAIVTTCLGVTSFMFAQTEGIVILWFVGLWFVGGATWIVVSPCRHVSVDHAGTAVFTTRRRTLVVEPGALVSITRPAALKFNPVMSMRVRTASQMIRYRAPVGSCDDLWSALSRANPHAQITSPHAWIYSQFSHHD